MGLTAHACLLCHLSTRNSPNGYFATAGRVEETELNAQTKHCSAKREKWAGCIVLDVCMKFH